MLSNLLTIPHVVHSNSQNYPNDIAMREKKFGVWKTKTWLEGIIANDVKVYAKNTPTVEAAGAGEIEVGFVNHYYLFSCFLLCAHVW